MEQKTQKLELQNLSHEEGSATYVGGRHLTKSEILSLRKNKQESLEILCEAYKKNPLTNSVK